MNDPPATLSKNVASSVKISAIHHYSKRFLALTANCLDRPTSTPDPSQSRRVIPYRAATSSHPID